MLEVKKDQAVETLRGREVWFNSYLKSCCTSMSRVCRELRVPRGDPEESAARYISWLNGACAQLEGIGQRIDEALKRECRRSSRYAGGAFVGFPTRSSSAAAPRVPPRRVFSFSENSYRDRWPGEVNGAAGGEGLSVDGLALAFLVVSASCDKCLREKV